METPLCRICGKNFRARMSPVCSASECRTKWRLHILAKRSGRLTRERQRWKALMERNENIIAVAGVIEVPISEQFLTVSAPPKGGIS
jgi:hypothetical protein